MTPANDDSESPEFVLDLGAPTRLAQIAPQVDELRAKGLPWKEIGRILRVRPGNAWTAWQRWKKAQPGAEPAA